MRQTLKNFNNTQQKKSKLQDNNLELENTNNIKSSIINNNYFSKSLMPKKSLITFNKNQIENNSIKKLDNSILITKNNDEDKNNSNLNNKKTLLENKNSFNETTLNNITIRDKDFNNITDLLNNNKLELTTNDKKIIQSTKASTITSEIKNSNNYFDFNDDLCKAPIQNNDNYNHMLELLKRPQYNVSSSSSDEDIVEKTLTTQLATTTIKPDTLQLNKIKKFEEQNEWKLKNKNLKLINNTSKLQNEIDSDSEFFN